MLVTVVFVFVVVVAVAFPLGRGQLVCACTLRNDRREEARNDELFVLLQTCALLKILRRNLVHFYVWLYPFTKTNKRFI